MLRRGVPVTESLGFTSPLPLNRQQVSLCTGWIYSKHTPRNHTVLAVPAQADVPCSTRLPNFEARTHLVEEETTTRHTVEVGPSPVLNWPRVRTTCGESAYAFNSITWLHPYGQSRLTENGCVKDAVEVFLLG